MRFRHSQQLVGSTQPAPVTARATKVGTKWSCSDPGSARDCPGVSNTKLGAPRVPPQKLCRLCCRCEISDGRKSLVTVSDVETG